jgi:hypothetical protein
MGPTTCWQCGKRFVRHPRTKRLIYVLVGNGLRVHKTCKESAELVLRHWIQPAPTGDARDE